VGHPATPFENGNGPVSQGASLVDIDIEPLYNTYIVIDDNIDGYISAWELILNNPGNWDNADQHPPTSPDTVNFTAQSCLASSYGLLQIVWPTTICCGAYWNDGNGGPPHELFQTRLNARLYSRISRYWFSQHWNGEYDDYQNALDSALRHYNGRVDYINDVRQWLEDFQIEWREL